VSNYDALLFAAVLRYAEAVANSRSASAAHAEADEVYRLANCDAIDLEASDREAHLKPPTETQNCMGFTSGPNHSTQIDPDASGHASAMAAITVEHARAEAMRTEVHAVKASREVEAAEASLLEVAANLTPGDPPVERTAPAKKPTQPTQPTTAADTVGETA
jgi:hypothetical protein